MDVKELTAKSLNRSREYLNKSLDGLTQEEFAWRPKPDCNSIAFILWHVTRVEDHFINRLFQRQEEIYESDGWRQKLGTPGDSSGYNYTVEQLQAWQAPKLEALKGYASAVRQKTLDFLEHITDAKLAEVPRPERSPDTVAASLAHISNEIAQHTGQIAYLRGMQRGLNK